MHNSFPRHNHCTSKGKNIPFATQGKLLPSFPNFLFFSFSFFLAENALPKLTWTHRDCICQETAFFSELMIVMKNFSELRQSPEQFWRDKVKMVQKSSQTKLYGELLKGMRVPNSLSDRGERALNSWMAFRAWMVTTASDSRRDRSSDHMPPNGMHTFPHGAPASVRRSVLHGLAFLPRSRFLHVAARLSYKMHILLKNPSNQLFSLTLLHFQSKEQPQHPPSSSLLFPSWQNRSTYIFPGMLVSLPRTSQGVIFNSIFSSSFFFMEELWKPSFFFPSASTSALPFPSLPHSLIKIPGLIPASCQTHGVGQKYLGPLNHPF